MRSPTAFIPSSGPNRSRSSTSRPSRRIRFVPASSSAKGQGRDRLAVLSQLQSVQDFIDAYYVQGPKAAAEMADLMNDGDPQVRRMAAQAISNWVHFGRTALPQELRALLIKALRDEDPEVRRLIPGPLARWGRTT